MCESMSQILLVLLRVSGATVPSSVLYGFCSGVGLVLGDMLGLSGIDATKGRRLRHTCGSSLITGLSYHLWQKVENKALHSPVCSKKDTGSTGTMKWDPTPLVLQQRRDSASKTSRQASA